MEQKEKNTHIKIFVIIIFFLSLFVSSKSHFKGEKEIKNRKNEKAEIISSRGDLKKDENLNKDIVYGAGDAIIEDTKQIFPKIKDNNRVNAGEPKKIIKKETAVQKDIITGASSSYFINLPVDARGVYIFDLKNKKEIFGKNAEIKFPLASLAKLMTAVAALENLDEEEIVEISKDAINEYGESNLSLYEKWKLYDLIDIMLVNSSNDAAYAISEKFKQIRGKGITGIMNEKAKELGMNKTVFYNSTGLDLGKYAGAYGTPKDIGILMNYIFINHPRLFLKTKEKSIFVTAISGEYKNFVNTNIYVDKLENLIGGKTGFTGLSGGNFSFIFSKGENSYYSVVMLNSSFTGRFNDALITQDRILKNNL